VAALRRLAIAFILASSSAANADAVDRWSDQIAEASRRFAIPAPWIRGVIRAESGGEELRHGRPIVSSSGAMGLMQLMPGTWLEMRSALGLGADPYDPHDNILAGTFYLRLMYDRFGYPGLFAAYDAGPARYAASLSGSPLPSETRAYVAKLARAGRPSSVDRRRDSFRTGGSALFAIAPAREARPGPAGLLQRSLALFVPLGPPAPE